MAGEKDRKSLASWHTSELILRIDSKLRNELMARSSTGLGRRRVDEEQINWHGFKEDSIIIIHFQFFVFFFNFFLMEPSGCDSIGPLFRLQGQSYQHHHPPVTTGGMCLYKLGPGKKRVEGDEELLFVFSWIGLCSTSRVIDLMKYVQLSNSYFITRLFLYRSLRNGYGILTHQWWGFSWGEKSKDLEKGKGINKLNWIL